MSNYTHFMTLYGFISDYLGNTQRIAVFDFRDVDTPLYEGTVREFIRDSDVIGDYTVTGFVKAMNTMPDYPGVLVIDIMPNERYENG